MGSSFQHVYMAQKWINMFLKFSHCCYIRVCAYPGCEDSSLTRDTQMSLSPDTSTSTYREYESPPRDLVPPVLSEVFPGVFRVEHGLTGKQRARPLGSAPSLPRQTATATQFCSRGTDLLLRVMLPPFNHSSTRPRDS